MRTVNGLEELKALVGQEIGISEWMKIDQQRINDFADATLDHQWIHINEEKAKMSPIGSTIAHGFLTLSLLPNFMEEIWKIDGIKMGINYGLNKVRFTAMVPVNSRIRMKATLNSLEDVSGGVQMTVTAIFEIEGNDKPACIAESLTRLYF
ncbi:MAG: MaoC family dehydratase [Microscillaceae bacterium]|nr:MaoC family dehydratase [Microscillaceae bacterium]